MPIEMGMGLFHALQTQRRAHRCAFFVPNREYQVAASDVLGLDPKYYELDDVSIMACVYDWLRGINAAFNVQPTVEIVDKFKVYKSRFSELKGSGKNGEPTHDEAQELMFEMCTAWKWWQWRATPLQAEFPIHPLSWKDGP